MKPHRMMPQDDFGQVLKLIQVAFAPMEGRIDPPSSVDLLTENVIAQQAEKGEVWAINSPVQASVFLTKRTHVLYISKLAVHPAARRQGYAHCLLDLAHTRAKALKLIELELQTRVELTQNHAFFQAMGFVQTAKTAHEGFSRPTSLTFLRKVMT